MKRELTHATIFLNWH